MQKRLRNIIAAAVVILTSLAAAAPSQSAAPTGKPIVIGLLTPKSGGASMYGITSEAGGQIAVDEINAAGGVLGRPLKLVTRDDQNNPEVGLRNAKELLMSEKADFLTGGMSSAVAVAISNYIKREKKLFFINISQSSSITEENFHPYVFRINTNSVPYWGYAPAIALAKTKRPKKIILLSFDYETGRNAVHKFKEKYLELVPDAKFIDELWTPLNTTDFTPLITKIANSGADAFVLGAIFGGGELAFTKQAQAFGLYDKMLGVQACAGDVETWSNVKRGEPYPKDALATTRYPFWMFKDKRNQAFGEKHKKMTGLWPSYGAMNEYTIIYTLKAAIEKVGAVDTEKMIKALEGMTLDTLVGEIPIRAYDHQAIMPTWFGTMGFTPDLPFPHIVKPQITKEEAYHTVQQIKALRGGK